MNIGIYNVKYLLKLKNSVKLSGKKRLLRAKMKVLLFNGSSNHKGCTYTALSEIEKVLNAKDIETEMVQIGNSPIADCTGCQYCRKTGNGKCVLDDIVNECIDKCINADGFIFGSPVYYAHPAGRLLSFMDRLFYAGGYALKYKPAAAVVSARRAGTTAALDPIIKHLTINNMPVVPSNYWTMVHGRMNSPHEVMQDEEGVQIMQVLGLNMAWMLHCIEEGKKAGFEPEKIEKIHTNFIK